MGVVEYGSRTVLYREIEGNTTGQTIVDFIEVLAADANPECPTVVVLDRASVHTCSAVNQQRKRWQDLGLIIVHLPAYSPELNDMEPEWRHLKYQELPERHYQNKTDLRRAVGEANWGIMMQSTTDSYLSSRRWGGRGCPARGKRPLAWRGRGAGRPA